MTDSAQPSVNISNSNITNPGGTIMSNEMAVAATELARAMGELAKALTPQVSANSYGVYVTTHKQEP